MGDTSTDRTGPGADLEPAVYRRRLAALLAAFAAVVLWRLGAAPVTSQAELRVADVVREMLASGEWLVPRRGGEPWVNKPPLAYWLSVVLGAALGRFDTWLLRLPAAASAVGLVAVTAAWGRRAGGRRLGLVAALLFAPMLLVHSQAREGVADMPLALAANLAFLAFLDAWRARRRRALPLFALAAAAAMLAKATVALLVIGLPIALFLAWRRELRDLLRPAVLGWSLAALVVGFLWWPAVFAAEPAAWERVVAELVKPVGMSAEASGHHYRPVWAHLGYLVRGAPPTILLVPLAVGAARRTGGWREAPELRFALVVFLGLLGAFSLLPQKQDHYLLPLLPALALLTAAGALEAWSRGALARTRRAVAALAPAVALLGAVVGAFFLHSVLAVSPLAWIPLVAAVLGAGVLASRAALRERWLAACVAAGGAWAALLGLHYGVLDVWRARFKVGTAELQPGWAETRWPEARERHPDLLRGFRPKRDWVEDYFGVPPEPPPPGAEPPRMPPVDRTTPRL